jgi:hypothetical protein
VYSEWTGDTPRGAEHRLTAFMVRSPVVAPIAEIVIGEVERTGPRARPLAAEAAELHFVAHVRTDAGHAFSLVERDRALLDRERGHVALTALTPLQFAQFFGDR